VKNTRITYTNDIPDRESYHRLFETTGWNTKYGASAEELHTSIQQSWHLVSAFDADHLVGFGRTISDGIMHALIVDMIVLPEYQGRGIGGRILTDLLERCREHNIRDIQLFCARGKAGFYRRFGFVVRPDDAPGMQFDSQPA